MTQHLFYSFQSGSTTPNFKISLEDPQVSSDHGMSRMDMGYSGCGCQWEEEEAEATEGACRSPHAHWARAAHPRVHICGQLLLFSSLWFRGNVSPVLSVPWPINNPHLLSWQPAPRFCPCLQVRLPERPGLHPLGDRLPTSLEEHL